jgi:1,4-dihydroxy-2-naphthoate octaprenyltransferase
MDLRTSTTPLTPAEGLGRLAGFPFALLTWVDDDGYPLSAAIEATVDQAAGRATVRQPAGLDLPVGREVSLTGSHIRPQPGFGYDERRHVTVWGRLERLSDGSLGLSAQSAWGWDESDVPFPEYAERTVGQSKRYYAEVSAEQGRRVGPRLSTGWLTLRATRLPFLSATLIPVGVGLAIAAAQGYFNLFTAVVTVIGAAATHLALNVANDVFDARQGADDANVNPTKYSGGSRVIQYGLVSLPRMALISAALYSVALVAGLILLVTSWSVALLVIGILGIVLSIEYTAPPLKLVYRGLGELTTAIGFGPLMLLGAYVVQSGGTISVEAAAASVPIAILVALILYVNEIPDREGDARAGKRTLPVQLSRDAVIRVYEVAVVAAFAWIVVMVAVGVLPVPALIALAGAPYAIRVVRGLRASYDQPYALMPVMGTNIRLHMVTGILLLAAYLVVIGIDTVAPGTDLYMG